MPTVDPVDPADSPEEEAAAVDKKAKVPKKAKQDKASKGKESGSKAK